MDRRPLPDPAHAESLSSALRDHTTRGHVREALDAEGRPMVHGNPLVDYGRGVVGALWDALRLLGARRWHSLGAAEVALAAAVPSSFGYGAEAWSAIALGTAAAVAGGVHRTHDNRRRAWEVIHRADGERGRTFDGHQS